MATVNPFDLLGDDDTEDPSQLIQKIEPKKALAPSTPPKHQPQTKPAAAAGSAKLPSKPLPPAQAVREERPESARGGRGGRGYGRGRGRGRGYNRDSTNNGNSYGNVEISGGQGESGEADAKKPFERRGGYGGSRGPYGGGRRGGFSNGEVGEGEQERPRRVFDRHSGSGHGNEMKREGAGRGNWGAQTDEQIEVTDEVVNEGEKNLNAEKPSGEEDAVDGNKETSAIEIEEKEPEDKEMTLEEYEKVLVEKRKALHDLKIEGRKVDVKEFESMQQLANKKNNDDIFIKLGSFKDKKKELAEKEERAKKSVSINEFLKPPEGDRYYTPGGRGRGRGRGSRGGYNGGGEMSNVKAPAIEDPGQFPTLGGK
ncbi:RGG repeats nuclear RNA binding protein A-like [Olea europaea var. sylvestris]|uniref:RGG repeats nuclear RNA binding protein A-like n=1 Tax=Olea europaea var. sylvestris TaxID=158386 RepID=UPI000C1D28DC|nr:RGG repeats nuclear RNA binding protein A-like [Olea europaea var. sylvestris]